MDLDSAISGTVLFLAFITREDTCPLLTGFVSLPVLVEEREYHPLRSKSEQAQCVQEPVQPETGATVTHQFKPVLCPRRSWKLNPPPPLQNQNRCEKPGVQKTRPWKTVNSEHLVPTVRRSKCVHRAILTSRNRAIHNPLRLLSQMGLLTYSYLPNVRV